MYPQCRHIRLNGSVCAAPSLTNDHWCYFHASIHERQAHHQARLRSELRHRAPDGRFAALPAPGDPAGTPTIDHGTYPVGTPVPAHPALDLPPIEDAASIQFAITDVLQALAANQLDPRRAGLLLYGLQVASANLRQLHIPRVDTVTTVTRTEQGTPLAPQEYGYDIDDYECECDEDNCTCDEEDKD